MEKRSAGGFKSVERAHPYVLCWVDARQLSLAYRPEGWLLSACGSPAFDRARLQGYRHLIWRCCSDGCYALTVLLLYVLVYVYTYVLRESGLREQRLTYRCSSSSSSYSLLQAMAWVDISI